MSLPDPAFWARQRVLLTGHTGFKGAWAALWLESMGAVTTAFALAPESEPNLYRAVAPLARFTSVLGDIRDRAAVERVVAQASPTVVLHMAAQPLVRRSYREPVETFAANVMGTAYLLEALRKASALKAVLVVTTDKVYRNEDDGRDFAEHDPLGGDDPYSASKAGTELTVAAWAESFLRPQGVAVATARAGNVVGGGDWSEDRIVPDIWRAAKSDQQLVLRNPNATRPWQHVIEALCGYLLYLERLSCGALLPCALNFGPKVADKLTVADVADAVQRALGVQSAWTVAEGPHPPERKFLGLDPSLAQTVLGWRQRLSGAEMLQWTAEWYRRFDAGDDARSISLAQLRNYGVRVAGAAA